jgi:hypothetical protein
LDIGIVPTWAVAFPVSLYLRRCPAMLLQEEKRQWYYGSFF